MTVTDLSGFGRVSAEIRKLVLGLAQLICQRETRKILNHKLRAEVLQQLMKNIAELTKTLQGVRSVPQPDYWQELATLEEILSILEEVIALCEELTLSTSSEYLPQDDALQSPGDTGSPRQEPLKASRKKTASTQPPASPNLVQKRRRLHDATRNARG